MSTDAVHSESPVPTHHPPLAPACLPSIHCSNFDPSVAASIRLTICACNLYLLLDGNANVWLPQVLAGTTLDIAANLGLPLLFNPIFR